MPPTASAGGVSAEPVGRFASTTAPSRPPLVFVEAVVWLNKDVAALTAVLHPGVEWVQLPDAGVERWLGSSVVCAGRDVTSARGCYGPQVAEHALALILASLRGLTAYARAASWR